MEKEKSILELCTAILGKVSNLEIGCDLAISATELMLRENYVRINVNRHLTPQEIKSFRKENIYKEKEKFSDLVNLFNTLYMGIGFGGIEKDFAKTILKFIEENGPNHRYDVVTVEPTRTKNEVKYLN